jgi:hypothetical protein
MTALAPRTVQNMPSRPLEIQPFADDALGAQLLEFAISMRKAARRGRY